jgi:serine phosphatase RsbU (regulator of sigma subunit)
MRKTITIWVVAFMLAVGFQKNCAAELVVSDTTPMMFNDKDILVFQDFSGSASAREVLDKTDKFVSPKQIKSFTPTVNYWILQKIRSQLSTDRIIQIDATGWRDVQPYVIDHENQIKQLKSTGFVGARNAFLEISPFSAKIGDNNSQFPIFTLKAGSEITLLTQVSFHPIFPAKSFSLNLVDNSSFSEFRRFSLYVEGLLLGVLVALTIFSIFNAFQTKDKVNIYYAIWITIAFLSVSSLSIIDGHRLFEFFIDLEGFRASWTDSYAYIIFIILAFAQSISYVLFARQYLGIQKNFPKIFLATSVWIAYALLYCFLAATGAFYSADSLANPRFFAMPYSISVGLILITFSVCSYLQYRAGSGFALYFTFAVIPYLVFRLGFLFGIIGIPSPFQYLPDYGFGYILKNPWTNQAFGVCMEALIMALAVISRARWLQSELNLAANKHTEVIQQQNVLLEEKVQERTQELQKKHEIVIGSVNYASLLQRGQLPRSVRVDNRFESFATLWEPRDTIGGDLYWISSSQHEGPFVLAVADCTGHGVPGAMLSLLVSTSLERIYAKSTAIEPTTALKSLDYHVRTGLNQDRIDSETNDGCDAAMVRIHTDKKFLEYAGAKIDLFHVDQLGQVHQHKSNRISLGYKDQHTTSILPTKIIHYQSGDLFAIVTDGLLDQPGGNNIDRPVSFGYRRFTAIIKKFKEKDCSEIVKELQADFETWQGLQPRRDDMTVVLFKL